MSKNILLIVVLFVFLAGAGCSTNNLQKNEEAQIGVIISTTEPQDAEFYIAYGWVGGMGSMPILNSQKTGVLQYENLPVYFDESQNEAVQNKLPSCYEGRPEIKILAKIKLEKNTSINESIPPDENGNQPEESFYEAKVLELKNIEVKAEECSD